MAIATTIIFALEDDKGKKSNTKIKVPTGFAISDYQEFAEGAAQLITNITNAAVTSVSINFAVDLTGIGLKTVVSGVCSVTRKIQGLYNTASGIIAKWLLPGLLETKVVAGSDNMDLTDSDVAALNTAYTSGVAVTGGTLTPTNGRGDDITSLSQMTETFRGRNAG